MNRLFKQKETLQFGIITFLPALLFQTQLLIFLAPIPLMYGYFKYGRRVFAVTSLLSLVVVGISGSVTMTALYFLTVVFTALVFSEVSTRKRNLNDMFVYAIGFILLSYLFTLVVVSNGHPYLFAKDSIYQLLIGLPETLKALGLKENAQLTYWSTQLTEISKNAEVITTKFLNEYLIGYVVSGLVVMFWLSITILKPFGIKITRKDLSKWVIPHHLIWLLLASYLFSQLSLQPISAISKNVFSVMMLLYFLQGIAIAVFYFNHRKYTKVQRNFASVILFIFPLLTTGIGFADLWVNFRKRITGGTAKPVS